jgi:hypothetical protein
MAVAMGVQALLLTDATPVGLIIALNVVFGMGMSMVMTPLMTLALSSLPRELYADGSASMNTLQQLAGAIGTALFVAMLTVGSAAALGGRRLGRCGDRRRRGLGVRARRRARRHRDRARPDDPQGAGGRAGLMP